MLVLSRKLKQEIMIGDDIKITVLKVKGNTVRLGIEAPRDIHVLRGEIPKKSDVIGPEKAREKASDSPMADFTVVFTNSDEAQGSKVDLIPFEQPKTDEPNFKIADTGSKGQSQTKVHMEPGQSVDSIQFRDRLPQVLHHNRLKEIVSQLTSK